MIQRVLASKGLVAYVLACATGITLYFRWPFPENDLMLHLISIRSPLIYVGFKYTYTMNGFEHWSPAGNKLFFTTVSGPEPENA